MNKHKLLEWALRDAQEIEDDFICPIPDTELDDVLFELHNRRPVKELPSLPKDPEAMIRVLRNHFKNNVSLVSLVLNHHFPDQFLFYHVSKLEPEIFEALDFFAEIVPEFTFPFSRIGKKGIERYLQFNESILAFARAKWPELKFPQARLMALLYAGFAKVFLRRSDYNRYWIMATGPDYFWALDQSDKVDGWSGRKEMKVGDLVFMYRMAPRKAITDLYRVQSDPFFDPWAPWDGFWVDLQRICIIDDIPFSEMRQDLVFSQWSTVRKQFTGTVTELVPHNIYNRLLTKIAKDKKETHHLTPEPLARSGRSGEFASEADFEKDIIVPLLKRWHFRFRAQYPCRFQFGSQVHRGYVDFYVSDKQGDLTLFENKLRIINDHDLERAMEQAKSYALMLGLPSCVVASPEGVWVYRLVRNQASLEQHLSADELRERDQEIRTLLLKLRS